MSVAFDTIALPHPGPEPRGLDTLSDSHGVSPRAARMYTRFFGQDHVLVCDATHTEMLRDTLRALVAERPELRELSGIACYAKTQTHNTPADSQWLRALFDEVGLPGWDVATVSMTNCASALAAVHAYIEQDRPLLVLAGEKAFHACGNRLAVGLLGEAPAAALFLPGAGRRVRFSKVRHAPRYFLNPDDMGEEDKRDLQTAFETGLLDFLAECVAQDPDFFAAKPVLVPYNLNVPLVSRVLDKLGLTPLVQDGHSGRAGHSFCSDTFVNLATQPVPPDRPVLLFCAGMGVTYAALALAPDPTTSSQNPTPERST